MFDKYSKLGHDFKPYAPNQFLKSFGYYRCYLCKLVVFFDDSNYLCYSIDFNNAEYKYDYNNDTDVMSCNEVIIKSIIE